MRFNFQEPEDTPEPRRSPTPKEPVRWVPLQNHPVFSSPPSPHDEPAASQRFPRNFMAWDGDSRLYYWDSTRYLLHRLSLRLGEPEPTSVLAAVPSKVPFPNWLFEKLRLGKSSCIDYSFLSYRWCNQISSWRSPLTKSPSTSLDLLCSSPARRGYVWCICLDVLLWFKTMLFAGISLSSTFWCKIKVPIGTLLTLMRLLLVAGWFLLAQKYILVVTVPYTCSKRLGILIVILIWEFFPPTQFSGNSLWGLISDKDSLKML